MSDLVFNQGELAILKGDSESYSCNALRLAMRFLKIFNRQNNFKFSFVPKENGLLPSLSLEDNLLLDFEGNLHNASLWEEIFNFSNVYFQNLLNNIGPMDIMPQRACKEAQKTLSIVKGIWNQADFLILDQPEESLGTNNQIILAKALKTTTEMLGTRTLVRSDNLDFWSQYATKIITPTSSGDFLIYPILKNKIAETFLPLKNKVSLHFDSASNEQEEKKSGLHISTPNSFTKKDMAS